MITNDFKVWEISCDFCPTGSVEVEGTFYEMIEEIKAEGWTISKKTGTWQHRCPDCEE